MGNVARPTETAAMGSLKAKAVSENEAEPAKNAKAAPRDFFSHNTRDLLIISLVRYKFSNARSTVCLYQVWLEDLFNLQHFPHTFDNLVGVYVVFSAPNLKNPVQSSLKKGMLEFVMK
ncbi:unnamed protein product [Protopolystoma xenopodis]|uniref:Uncharacterized protein n=1 Tax=Protopolystoma xenopodis TaxID=117903 RepID=A0A3S5CMU4_9PLAT|nr:unnamed protein product [Protopolystoma xenopodis]